MTHEGNSKYVLVPTGSSKVFLKIRVANPIPTLNLFIFQWTVWSSGKQCQQILAESDSSRLYVQFCT